MQCLKVVFDNGSVVFDVSGAFFLICPVQEFYGGRFCSSTAGTTKWFTSKTVMDMIGVTGRQKIDADDTGHIRHATDFFFQNSVILRKQFKRNCNEALTSRKNVGKRFF